MGDKNKEESMDPNSIFRTYQPPPANAYLCGMRKLSTEELDRKSVEEFKVSEKIPVIAVLENIRSAYNVGSVFRTSDAFLLEAIYIIGYSAKPPHKEIKKTALGAEDTVAWKYFKTTTEAIQDLRQMDYQVFAVEQVEGSLLLHEMDFMAGQRVAVIFGNEVTGVEQSTIHECDGCIEIPQLGMKHSLNIATAAGVVLWEIVRERLNKKKITRQQELK
jgi:tRNA G18 (ribose-2'-O)-methylase SpoU